ncbi:hypothetical protein TSH58p_03090 (plasmid) [Azospirillum sp. TSH58]|nr:hypothetical protein TSH58p_03090 [Azospirillum sp. TSH58]
MAQKGGTRRERSARSRASYREGISRWANGTRPAPGLETGSGPCVSMGDPPPASYGQRSCHQRLTGSSGRR